jgi:hypothetical protein
LPRLAFARRLSALDSLISGPYACDPPRVVGVSSLRGHNLLALGDFNIDRIGDPLFEAFTSTGLTPPADDLEAGSNR